MLAILRRLGDASRTVYMLLDRPLGGNTVGTLGPGASEGVEALREQIARDVKKARRYFQLLRRDEIG